MPLSRMENTTFAMPNIIDSHDMGLRTVLQSRRPKENAYSENTTIVGVMQTCKELSEVQNGIIFGFREKVGSISETAKFVDCSCVTVVKVYRAWQNGTVQNQ
ncbi:HTH_Tnp_Tc3_2 domain-containing protein [Trichonephila clavipes]|nr:HTH_Tnp_Tc3_2 domain-containing protein [Trichonephila clavipes]